VLADRLDGRSRRAARGPKRKRVNSAQKRTGLAGHSTQVAVSSEGASEAEPGWQSPGIGGGFTFEVAAQAGAEWTLVEGRRLGLS